MGYWYGVGQASLPLCLHCWLYLLPIGLKPVRVPLLPPSQHLQCFHFELMLVAFLRPLSSDVLSAPSMEPCVDAP